MAEKIPGEVLSPMIEDGVIYWCEGDIFRLHLTLALYAMGEEYRLSEGDKIEVSFLDKGSSPVKTFYAFADDCNCITLEFDSGTTSAFGKGRYTYDIVLVKNNGARSTIANNNVAVVV